MLKLFFLDLETTGLDPQKNTPWQFAGAPYIGGKFVTDIFDIKCRPFGGKLVAQEALDTCGITAATLQGFQPPPSAYRAIVQNYISPFIDKFDRQDKFFLVGYNVSFDKDFLRQFFIDCGDKYFGSYFHYYVFDLYYLCQALLPFGMFSKLPKMRLENVCQFFDIPIKAHDARSDIEATFALFKIFEPYITAMVQAISGGEQTIRRDRILSMAKDL